MSIFTLIKYCIFNDINDLLLTKNDNLFLNFHFDFVIISSKLMTCTLEYGTSTTGILKKKKKLVNFGFSIGTYLRM